MIVKEIADATYTVPSTLIRIAKKLNYDGQNDLKTDFLNECEYLQSHFSNIDTNLPLTNKDTIMSIAGKIATLKKKPLKIHFL